MIIEIIGPAGSGKSTLSKALSERLAYVRLENPPSFRKVEYIPFYVRNSLSLFPILSRVYLRNRRLPPKELFVFMVMLNGWHQELKQEALKSESIIILDQGPVYMLTILTMFDAGSLKSNNSEKYWDRAFRCWAETLDLVIWLDTSLPELVERIRTRQIWHKVKDRSDVDAYRYLESYRQGFENVISRLKACSNTLRILRLNTGRNSLEETMKNVIDELYLGDAQVKSQKQNFSYGNP